jgi:hypothetical protein
LRPIRFDTVGSDEFFDGPKQQFFADLPMNHCQRAAAAIRPTKLHVEGLQEISERWERVAGSAW